MKSNFGGAPQRRTSTFSSEPRPTGTDASSRFGIVSINSRCFASSSATRSSADLIRSDTVFISPINESAFSFAFFNRAISSLALFRCALRASFAVINSRRSLSSARNPSKSSAAPRFRAISANTSRWSRK